METESKVINRKRCPACAAQGNDTSGNNLAVYDDGHSYCYACKFYIKGTKTSMETVVETPVVDTAFRTGQPVALQHRRITEKTARRYGYMTGDGTAPNGTPSGAGIAFPQNPQVGDYFLRIDYMPNILYRWDGTLWVRISTNVRTDTGFTAADQSLLSGFINNSGYTTLTDGTVVDERQPLSSVLQQDPPVIPPEP